MGEQERTIEGSRQHIQMKMGWVIDEETFQVLDIEQCTWVARVTTTHFTKRGKSEQTFFVLVYYTDFLMLEESTLPLLTDWCLKMSARQGL